MNDHAPPECLPLPLTVAIRNAELITFDIFDTALIRATEKPVDIFALLAHEAGIENTRAFAYARIQAEALARHLAWENRRAVEVTLPEIYDCFTELSQFSKAPVCDFIEQERALELRLCKPHPVISYAFDWALQLDKKVGFISDMYLDAQIIEQMLIKCGYKKFDFLLVSSEAGTTKATGGLYKLIQKQLNTSPSQHLHIGDNMASDILQAQAAGLKTFHVTKIADRLPHSPIGKRFTRKKITSVDFSLSGPSINESKDDSSIWKSIWRGLIATHQTKANSDFWYNLGYTHVGILLLGFALWLNDKARQENVTQLYFLARDGHIMLPIHQMLQDHGLAHCPGRYLYASRRALNIPALTEINEQACDFLVSGVTRMSVGAFLSRAGLLPSESLPMILAAGFSGPDQMVLSGEDYGRLRAVFRMLAPVLLQQAGNERELLFEYLQQEKVFEQPHIGLVDIGWHGTLQESFCNLLSLWNKKNTVTGFYLGTFAAVKQRIEAGARQHAYLCEAGEPHRQLMAIKSSVEVFEWIFCAPHGSTQGFKRTPGGIEPILESGEWEKIRQVTATKMQSGALQFVRDALACFAYGNPPPPVSADLAISLLEDLLNKPMAHEATLLGNLPHAEGFGDVINIIPIARPESKLYNIFGWHELINGYRRTFWRTGYKRRLWPDCWFQ